DDDLFDSPDAAFDSSDDVFDAPTSDSEPADDLFPAESNDEGDAIEDVPSEEESEDLDDLFPAADDNDDLFGQPTSADADDTMDLNDLFGTPGDDSAAIEPSPAVEDVVLHPAVEPAISESLSVRTWVDNTG